MSWQARAAILQQQAEGHAAGATMGGLERAAHLYVGAAMAWRQEAVGARAEARSALYSCAEFCARAAATCLDRLADQLAQEMERGVPAEAVGLSLVR